MIGTAQSQEELLDAKRRGWVDRLQTLPSQDGLGFYIALAGRPEKAPEAR